MESLSPSQLLERARDTDSLQVSMKPIPWTKKYLMDKKSTTLTKIEQVEITLKHSLSQKEQRHFGNGLTLFNLVYQKDDQDLIIARKSSPAPEHLSELEEIYEATKIKDRTASFQTKLFRLTKHNKQTIDISFLPELNAYLVSAFGNTIVIRSLEDLEGYSELCKIWRDKDRVRQMQECIEVGTYWISEMMAMELENPKALKELQDWLVDYTLQGFLDNQSSILPQKVQVLLFNQAIQNCPDLGIYFFGTKQLEKLEELLNLKFKVEKVEQTAVKNKASYFQSLSSQIIKVQEEFQYKAQEGAVFYTIEEKTTPQGETLQRTKNLFYTQNNHFVITELSQDLIQEELKFQQNTGICLSTMNPQELKQHEERCQQAIVKLEQEMSQRRLPQKESFYKEVYDTAIDHLEYIDDSNFSQYYFKIVYQVLTHQQNNLNILYGSFHSGEVINDIHFTQLERNRQIIDQLKNNEKPNYPMSSSDNMSVLFVMGMPGLGKSLFSSEFCLKVNKSQQNELAIAIGSDAIRTKLWKQIRKEKPEISRKEIDDNSAEQINNLFFQELEYQMMASMYLNVRHQYIILDKNSYLKDIQKFKRADKMREMYFKIAFDLQISDPEAPVDKHLLKKLKPANQDDQDDHHESSEESEQLLKLGLSKEERQLNILAQIEREQSQPIDKLKIGKLSVYGVIPKVTRKHRLVFIDHMNGQKHVYPLTVFMLLASLKRVSQRKKHTLTGEGTEFIKVLLKLFQRFKGDSFTVKHIKEMINFDDIVTFPFHQDDQEEIFLQQLSKGPGHLEYDFYKEITELLTMNEKGIVIEEERYMKVRELVDQFEDFSGFEKQPDDIRVVCLDYIIKEKIKKTHEDPKIIEQTKQNYMKYIENLKAQVLIQREQAQQQQEIATQNKDLKQTPKNRSKSTTKQNKYQTKIEQQLIQQKQIILQHQDEDQEDQEDYLYELKQNNANQEGFTDQLQRQERQELVNTEQSKQDLYYLDGTRLVQDLEHNINIQSQIQGNQAVISQSSQTLNYTKRAPLFLGVQLNIEREIVRELCRSSIEFLTNSRVPLTLQEKELIQHDIQMINSWKFPNDFHITTLFVGGPKGFLSNVQNIPEKAENLQRFQNDQRFTFSIKGLVYSPGGLFAGVTFIDREKLRVDNEYPHMTLLMNRLKPADSNLVLKGLFKNTQYSKEYREFSLERIIQPVKQNFVLKRSPTIGFYIPLARNLLYEGVTKVYI